MSKMTVASPKKSAKRKVSHVSVERGANGGYIVNHRMEPPASPGASMGMSAMGPSQPPMPFSGKKAHKQASDHVAQLMAQMHDMPQQAEQSPAGVPEDGAQASA